MQGTSREKESQVGLLTVTGEKGKGGPSPVGDNSYLQNRGGVTAQPHNGDERGDDKGGMSG